MHDDCNCEFDPYDDGDTEESYHYKRTCPHCGNVWFGLHCPHDGAQNPCPECGQLPSGRSPTDLLFNRNYTALSGLLDTLERLDRLQFEAEMLALFPPDERT